MPSTKRIGFKINAENGYTYTFLLNASTRQSILKLNDYSTPTARGLHAYSDSYRGLHTQGKIIAV